MKTLDEVIEYVRTLARVHILRAKHPAIHRNDKDEIEASIESAREYEQLAEWLEELKAYREIGTVEGYKSAIECYTEEYNLRKSNKQYKKAIDDFVEKIIRYVDCGHLCFPTEIRWSDLSVVEMVRKIAEQLKRNR